MLLGLDRLGLNPVSQRHVTSGSRAGVWLIGCDSTDETARYCSECGAAGRVRSSWRRRFTHVPVGQNAVHLMVRVRRYECAACVRSWADNLTRIADEGRRLTDQAVWWACAEVVLKSKSVLGDKNMAAALIDRTVHHGRLIRFEGRSYRSEHG
ncbi:transposase family protein [Bifidobacterium longum]|nr:transposase family protein [Bifidobacterium longum]